MNISGTDPAAQSNKRGSNIREKVALEAVQKYWDKRKEEAEHEYGRELQQIRHHLYELNQRRFVIRVHHAIDNAVRRFSQTLYRYQDGGDVPKSPDTSAGAEEWKQTLMAVANVDGLDGDVVKESSTFRLVKIAEDKHWHQMGTSKHRPSNFVKFPRLATRRQTVPDARRTSFIVESGNRTAFGVNGLRRSSVPYNTNQPKPPFQRRYGPSRKTPNRMEHAYGANVLNKYPLPTSKTSHDPTPVPSLIDYVGSNHAPDHANAADSAQNRGNIHASQYTIERTPSSAVRRATIDSGGQPLLKEKLTQERESNEAFREDSKTAIQEPIAISSVMRQIARVNMPPPFDPVSTLNCRYLRLSENNVKELVGMCDKQGINVGIHGHMSEDEVIKYFERMKLAEKLLQQTGAGPEDIVDGNKIQQSKHDGGTHKVKTQSKHE